MGWVGWGRVFLGRYITTVFWMRQKNDFVFLASDPRALEPRILVIPRGIHGRNAHEKMRLWGGGSLRAGPMPIYFSFFRPAVSRHQILEARSLR